MTGNLEPAKTALSPALTERQKAATCTYSSRRHGRFSNLDARKMEADRG